MTQDIHYENKLRSDNKIASEKYLNNKWCQSAITCSKLTIETLEQSVKYVQS